MVANVTMLHVEHSKGAGGGEAKGAGGGEAEGAGSRRRRLREAQTEPELRRRRLREAQTEPEPRRERSERSLPAPVAEPEPAPVAETEPAPFARHTFKEAERASEASGHPPRYAWGVFFFTILRQLHVRIPQLSQYFIYFVRCCLQRHI